MMSIAEPCGHVEGQVDMPTLVDGWPRHPSVLERYYTTYRLSNGQSLHVHSNGLCVLGVSPDHPALQPPNRILSVEFRAHDAKNLMQAEVSGKKKGGAVFMSPRDMICTVNVSDGSSFKLFACVRGSIIEINKRLVEEPELLTSDPQGSGYVAILQPKLAEKGAIGQACMEFDKEAPFAQASSNEKRRLEGKQVRTNNNKKGRLAEKRACWDFEKKGSCKYGDKCRYGHPSGEQEAVPLVPPDTSTQLEQAAGANDGGVETSEARAHPAGFVDEDIPTVESLAPNTTESST